MLYLELTEVSTQQHKNIVQAMSRWLTQRYKLQIADGICLAQHLLNFVRGFTSCDLNPAVVLETINDIGHINADTASYRLIIETIYDHYGAEAAMSATTGIDLLQKCKQLDIGYSRCQRLISITKSFIFNDAMERIVSRIRPQR